MPDIAMCINKSCEHRYTCFRYMAQPNPYRQSYQSYKAFTCGDYWHVEKGDNVVTKGAMKKVEAVREEKHNKKDS